MIEPAVRTENARPRAPDGPEQPGGDGAGAGWLATPLGRRFIANEQRQVRRALDRMFGEQLLQIGLWGQSNTFLRHARTQHQSLLMLQEGRSGQGIVRLHDEFRIAGSAEPDLVGDPQELPVTSGSVDVVLLPHTLEATGTPHALLREVDRILRPDGHLLVLSFVPVGLWGLRFMLARNGYPPGRQRMIRERRLRDWLQLLSFEVGSPVRYCHTLPLERLRRVGTYPREDFAQRWLPLLAGGYMLSARKRVRIVTPMKPAWRQHKLRAVGGLVKPTTRTGSSQTRQRG